MEDFEIEEIREIQTDTKTIAKLTQIVYEKDKWKLSRWIWVNPSFEESELRLGDRVWPAGEDYNKHFELKEIKLVGEKFYPEGAYLCNSNGGKRVFYLDAIIKHPDRREKIEREYKKKRKKK